VTGPVAGTRGGLGRVLLTAFLLLAIVPLSVVSFLAIHRVQNDMRQVTVGNLARSAASYAELLSSWLGMQQEMLSFTWGDPSFQRAVRSGAWSDACQMLGRTYGASGGSIRLLSSDQEIDLCDGGPTLANAPMISVDLPVDIPGHLGEGRLVFYPRPSALEDLIRQAGQGPDERVFVVDGDGNVLAWSSFGAVARPERMDEGWAARSAVRGESGGGLYDDFDGIAVIGAYSWLADRDVAVIVEQPERTALAHEDDLAAMLIGSTLAVALLTAILAAVIVRQLTRPIVQLTLSAVSIANGDLSQSVEVNRRDEIGILAQAFNIMSGELRSLYDGLERKVAERTQQLVEANEVLRSQATQLKLSAEVGRVATSILDLDLLLDRVVSLIQESYGRVYNVHDVAVLLSQEFAPGLELKASSGDLEWHLPSSLGAQTPALAEQAISDMRVVQQRLGDGMLGVVVPLHVGPRAIGALSLYCSRPDNLAKPDLDVLQSLGDQISVAIENARVYAAERQTIERLSRLDHVRLASLGVGSRELATELNTIIGFSRLILKGADGPLNDLQRSDLIAIHKSGYSLLGLIDNVITLSELESGTLQPSRRALDLMTVVDEVVSMARQRLGGMAVGWRKEVGPLPVRGDAVLLRQALLSLLMAVAEWSQRGKIAVDALFVPAVPSGETGKVIVYVGNGEDWQDGRLCPLAACDALEGDELSHSGGDDVEEMSVGLILAKQIISLHEGALELELDREQGLNSLVTLISL
jgi:signal transduction histidine kinase/HAMP domain-containing protein